MHFLGDIDLNLENKIKNYLLSKQNKDGGWPLYFGGESNVSASVKAYYALKLSGVSTKEKIDENSSRVYSQKWWSRTK